MREKIQAIVEECFSDQINEPCAYCTATDRLLASFAAETAAMRDIIGRLPNVSCTAWETLEENMGYGEGELQAKIDTALKGGK